MKKYREDGETGALPVAASRSNYIVGTQPVFCRLARESKQRGSLLPLPYAETLYVDVLGYTH